LLWDGLLAAETRRHQRLLLLRVMLRVRGNSLLGEVQGGHRAAVVQLWLRLLVLLLLLRGVLQRRWRVLRLLRVPALPKAAGSCPQWPQ